MESIRKKSNRLKANFLIVLDNANHLIKQNKPDFPRIINEICTGCKYVKFLISSHYY